MRHSDRQRCPTRPTRTAVVVASAIGAVALLFASAGAAQEKRDSFFSQGYANGFYDRKQTKDAGLRGGSPLGEEAAPPLAGKHRPQARAGGKAEPRQETGVAAGEKVLALGVIVNGMDSAHFNATIKQLLELSRERNLRLQAIDVIGTADVLNSCPYTDLPNEALNVALAPPAEYPVS